MEQILLKHCTNLIKEFNQGLNEIIPSECRSTGLGASKLACQHLFSLFCVHATQVSNSEVRFSTEMSSDYGKVEANKSDRIDAFFQTSDKIIIISNLNIEKMN